MTAREQKAKIANTARRQGRPHEWNIVTSKGKGQKVEEGSELGQPPEKGDGQESGELSNNMDDAQDRKVSWHFAPEENGEHYIMITREAGASFSLSIQRYKTCF